LVPFFKNSDIEKYITNNKTDTYILYISREVKDISKVIMNFLNKYKMILIERREVKNKVIIWFQLQWPRYESIFNGRKIVAPQRSKTNTFGYNECEWYGASDIFFITTKNINYELKYILALLNSKLYFFWLWHKGKRKGNTLELIAKPLAEIPIKLATPKIQNEIISIIDKLLFSPKDTLLYSKQLDKLIYEIYGITKEEQDIINSLSN
jgi:adenine-specific DNA-methyltransferase